MENKEKVMSVPVLPWMISIEEFRKTGDFKNWSDDAIKSAINSLAMLTIIAFEIQSKKPRK